MYKIALLLDSSFYQTFREQMAKTNGISKFQNDFFQWLIWLILPKKIYIRQQMAGALAYRLISARSMPPAPEIFYVKEMELIELDNPLPEYIQ